MRKFTPDQVRCGIERMATKFENRCGESILLGCSSAPSSVTLMCAAAAIRCGCKVMQLRSGTPDGILGASERANASVIIVDSSSFHNIARSDQLSAYDITSASLLICIGAASSADVAKVSSSIEVEVLHFSSACLGPTFTLPSSTYASPSYKRYAASIYCVGELEHDLECVVHSSGESSSGLGRTRAIGELWVKGASVSTATFDKKKICDGSLVSTGDVGFCDSDGLWYIMPNSSPTALCPAACTRVVLSMDGIDDCAVVGWRPSVGYSCCLFWPVDEGVGDRDGNDELRRSVEDALAPFAARAEHRITDVRPSGINDPQREPRE